MNGALTYSAATQPGDPDATLTTTLRALHALALGTTTPGKLAAAGIEIAGDETVLGRLTAVLDPGDPDFSIVTP